MCHDEDRLVELCNRLGIREIPGVWLDYWPGFDEWKSGGMCGRMDWKLPDDAVDLFSLPQGALPDLDAMYAAIRASDDLREFAEFWHYMIYHLAGGMERETKVWGMPDTLLEKPTRLFSLAVMLSGSSHARQNFREARVDDEVVHSTLGYFGRYAQDVKRKRGVWGLESVGWLSNYARAKIFRLGRLTFKADECQLPFRVFRGRTSGELVALCDGSVRFRNDGLPDGTNGIYDPEAWLPTFKSNGHVVIGNAVTSDQTVDRQPRSLSVSEWLPVLSPGDPIVEVHIAGGSRLSPTECADSFRRAIDFFPRRYSPTTFAGFTCISWLLDPGMPRIVGEESNIVQFARKFNILSLRGDERQAYDLVFGNPTADPLKETCNTSLQRAIAEYVAAGNRMRSAGGYITWASAQASFLQE